MVELPVYFVVALVMGLNFGRIELSLGIGYAEGYIGGKVWATDATANLIMSKLCNLYMGIPRIYNLFFLILVNFMGAFVSRMSWYVFDVLGCLWKIY